MPQSILSRSQARKRCWKRFSLPSRDPSSQYPPKSEPRTGTLAHSFKARSPPWAQLHAREATETCWDGQRRHDGLL